MLNEEIHAQYQAVDEIDGISQSQGGESSAIDGEVEDEYGDEEMEYELEFTKIKRENVFAPVDYSKRKTKMVATLG